jgi:hypothetical protein
LYSHRDHLTVGTLGPCFPGKCRKTQTTERAPLLRVSEAGKPFFLSCALLFPQVGEVVAGDATLAGDLERKM